TDRNLFRAPAPARLQHRSTVRAPTARTPSTRERATQSSTQTPSRIPQKPPRRRPSGEARDREPNARRRRLRRPAVRNSLERKASRRRPISRGLGSARLSYSTIGAPLKPRSTADAGGDGAVTMTDAADAAGRSGTERVEKNRKARREIAADAR